MADSELVLALCNVVAEIAKHPRALQADGLVKFDRSPILIYVRRRRAISTYSLLPELQAAKGSEVAAAQAAAPRQHQEPSLCKLWSNRQPSLCKLWSNGTNKVSRVSSPNDTT